MCPLFAIDEGIRCFSDVSCVRVFGIIKSNVRVLASYGKKINKIQKETIKNPFLPEEIPLQMAASWLGQYFVLTDCPFASCSVRQVTGLGVYALAERILRPWHSKG